MRVDNLLTAKIKDDLLLATGALKDAAGVLKSEGRVFDAHLVLEALNQVQGVAKVVTSGR